LGEQVRAACPDQRGRRATPATAARPKPPPSPRLKARPSLERRSAPGGRTISHSRKAGVGPIRPGRPDEQGRQSLSRASSSDSTVATSRPDISARRASIRSRESRSLIRSRHQR
jgi:hypothetical protein